MSSITRAYRRIESLVETPCPSQFATFAISQYINSVLAVRYASSRGYDEALLLNVSGQIADAAGENPFVIHSKKLATNAEDDSILPGITRASVMTLARDLGYEVQSKVVRDRKPLDCDDLSSRRRLPRLHRCGNSTVERCRRQAWAYCNATSREVLKRDLRTRAEVQSLAAYC